MRETNTLGGFALFIARNRQACLFHATLGIARCRENMLERWVKPIASAAQIVLIIRGSKILRISDEMLDLAVRADILKCNF